MEGINSKEKKNSNGKETASRECTELKNKDTHS